MTTSKEVAAITKEIQQDLYQLMAELAATQKHREKFQKLGPERVRWIEEQIASLSPALEISEEFIIFGYSSPAAAYNLARTIVRRAERVVAKLHHQGDMEYGVILQYLNRLSSLCFVLALWEMQKNS
jgi:cob(I)alamin adenosyltransferase